LQSAKFESFPRSNQNPLIFSPQRIRILQNHPLYVPTDQVKNIQTPDKKKSDFYEQNQWRKRKIQVLGEKLKGEVKICVRSRRIIRRC